ncbi:MAG TPA: CDP-glycerol--glycerophosphate glycerophosphotransferase [Bacteroidales bacterium]|nr:CDP-glycerol--glycerophosphate glycerophosphotransferase [Bacteroidales bacterium]
MSDCLTNKLLKLFKEQISKIVKSVIDASLIFMVPLWHRRKLKKLRGRKKFKIVFFALNSSAWKFETLYRLMEKDEHFDPLILVCPITYYDRDNMIRLMDKEYDYFRSHGYSVLNSCNSGTGNWLDVKKEIAPDVIFFTHPWDMSRPQYLIRNYLDHLTCYSPYGFYVSDLHRKSYSDFFYSALWRNFLETEIHKGFYSEMSKRPSNGVVTGYPWADLITDKNYKPGNPWKKSIYNLKRIIWAPHHTIPEQGNSIDFSSFLTYSGIMISVAERLHDRIQIAFKPHPLLKKKLYTDPGWGKERTDKYYLKWALMDNGQLCEDDYSDLFLTSDAMIHDSMSFIAEYLYAGKPSLFLMNDPDIEKRLNEIGKLAVRQHYHAFNEKDISDFIEDVVLAGNDIKEDERKEFCNIYLKPPNSVTASENIFNEIRACLFNA